MDASKYYISESEEEPIRSVEPDQEESSYKPEEKKESKKKKISIGKSLLNLISGNVLASDSMLRHMPFILYLALLGLLYISNSYYAERTVRDIVKTKKKVEELDNEHISSIVDKTEITKQSQIVTRLQTYGIREAAVPPFKIYK